MGVSQEWQQFPKTYREAEAKLVASWIAAGESGSVIGFTGVGRTTFLEFLCFRPDVLEHYLAPYPHSVHLIPVDLHNLPDDQLSTFYRILLRSFYEQNARFKSLIQQTIRELYRKAEISQDPFLSQSALRELLTLFQDQEVKVVLVMNRFDRFCQTATPQMIATLRGLRDSFRETLSYIMGIVRDVVYLAESDNIKPLRGILDTYVCRVGPLAEADARYMIQRQTRFLDNPIPEPDTQRLLELSGGYPSLLRVLCHWWMTESEKVSVANWAEVVSNKSNCQHRLRDIWQGLTEEEQFVLAEFGLGQASPGAKRSRTKLEQTAQAVLEGLAARGMCYEERGQWWIVGELVMQYVKQAAAKSRGRIWQNAETKEIFQGRTLVTGLQPLQHALLEFLLTRPRQRLTHNDLIEAIWPDEMNKEGVSTEALYQVIRGIRKAIETDTSKPRYLINWRGAFEGGYQFFPEGRPD